MRTPVSVMFGAATACMVLACPQPTANWDVAFDATSSGWLMNVWGGSSTDVWAVGGAPDSGRVMRFDGAMWREERVPPGTPLLDWTIGFAADDVWIVGREGTVLHWDGSAFEGETSGTDEDLWGVWGTSAENLWAVGGSGFPDATATLLHRTATGWSSVALPPLMRSEVHALFKVWGSAEDDVWAVGQRGVVLHYDGAVWEERLVGTGEDLIAVWGTGRDHVAMVGGRGNGVLVVWDGATYARRELNLVPGLNGVWMGEPEVLHIVGVNGTRMALAWDGTPLRDDSTYMPNDLHAVFGTSDRLFAVGGNLNSVAGPYRGVALTRRRLGGE